MVVAWFVVERIVNFGCMGVQSHTEYKSLERSGVHMSWDGRRMLAPEGLLTDGRYVDLEPFARKHH